MNTATTVLIAAKNAKRRKKCGDERTPRISSPRGPSFPLAVHLFASLCVFCGHSIPAFWRHATSRHLATVRVCVFAFSLFLTAPRLLAQLPPGARAQGGIELPDYDKQTQRLKSLLRGQSAVQLPNGGVLLNSMRVEIYSYDGETRKVDVVVEAPSCTFDFKERVASSPGPLLLRREDGKLLVAGVGFEWRQLGAQLYISNNVQTVIARGSRGL